MTEQEILIETVKDAMMLTLSTCKKEIERISETLPEGLMIQTHLTAGFINTDTSNCDLAIVGDASNGVMMKVLETLPGVILNSNDGPEKLLMAAKIELLLEQMVEDNQVKVIEDVLKSMGKEANNG